MENTNKTSLNHVAWVVDDLQLTSNFLVAHFDFKAGQKHQIKGAWADQLSGMKGVIAYNIPMVNEYTSTKIELLKFDNPPNLKSAEVDRLNLQGFRHIGFAVDDIHQKTKELMNAGYKFFSDVVTSDEFHVMSVYLWGPEDVVLQLSQSIKT